MRKPLAYILALAATLVVACGTAEDSGPYGSWGSEQTNVRVLAALAPESYDVDICDGASTAVIADLLTEAVIDGMPMSELRLQGYDLSFSTDQTGAPPLFDASYSISGVLPVTGLNLMFIDPGVKADIVNALNAGDYPSAPDYPVYTARYTIYGTDNVSGLSRLWGINEAFSFRLGRYSDCPLVVVPTVAAVTGLANPDADTSDDINISITGGRTPYTLSSDSALISAPATLAQGQSTVTLDPGASLSPPAVVTITVTDADAQTATVTVTIN